MSTPFARRKRIWPLGVLRSGWIRPIKPFGPIGSVAFGGSVFEIQYLLIIKPVILGLGLGFLNLRIR